MNKLWRYWCKAMGSHYIKSEPVTTKKISNAAPVFAFAFFYVCVLIMIGSIK